MVMHRLVKSLKAKVKECDVSERKWGCWVNRTEEEAVL
jgi:hypothetical protein